MVFIIQKKNTIFTHMIFDFSIDRGGTFTDIYCEISDAATGEHQSVVSKLLSVDP